MRLKGVAISVLTLMGVAMPGHAQTAAQDSAPAIIIAVPAAQYPALAVQISDGASAALAEAGMRAVIVDAPCDPVMAAPVAAEAAALAPLAIIGLPCGEALEAFAATFSDTATPIVTVGSRAPSRDAPGNIVRVGPREAAEAQAVAELLSTLWRETPFAILDDGSVHARSLAEALRDGAESGGRKPVLIGEFRPGEESQAATVQQLAAAGAKAAFVAGDGEDIARIAAEAGSAGLPITLAGTESMLHSVAEGIWPDGTLLIARTPPPAGAIARLKAARTTPFAEVEGYVADAHAAAQVAIALASDPASLTFQTILGDLERGEDGFLDPAGFQLFEMRGGVFAPASQ